MHSFLHTRGFSTGSLVPPRICLNHADTPNSVIRGSFRRTAWSWGHRWVIPGCCGAIGAAEGSAGCLFGVFSHSGCRGVMQGCRGVMGSAGSFRVLRGLSGCFGVFRGQGCRGVIRGAAGSCRGAAGSVGVFRGVSGCFGVFRGLSGSYRGAAGSFGV